MSILSASAADVGNLTGLGVGGILLVLIFRTLWKFSADSSELARNYDAALERAQHDATLARAEAANANERAAAAWREVGKLERANVELERKHIADIADLRITIAGLEARLARD